MSVDLPNVFFVFYLARLMNGRMPPAEALAMLQDAFNRDEINREELERLLEVKLSETVVNAPGGDA